MVTFLIPALLSILSFVLGFLAASVYFSRQEQQKQAQWDRQMQKMLQKLNQAQEAAKQAKRCAAETKYGQTRQLEAQSAAVRQIVPGPQTNYIVTGRISSQDAEAEAQYQERLYESFAARGSMKLQFQYSFPEQHFFCQGTGFAYNRQGELLPQREAFTRTNTAISYAKEGLFFVYDVVYKGTEYTFPKIMDGAMGNGFVRIRKCIRPARIREGGTSGCYVLAKKGKLEVVDL